MNTKRVSFLLAVVMLILLFGIFSSTLVDPPDDPFAPVGMFLEIDGDNAMVADLDLGGFSIINGLVSVEFALSDTEIFIGDATDTAVGRLVSGDVLINNTGVASIQPDAVTLTTDTTGDYAAGDAEAGNATGLACTDCVALTAETTGNYLAGLIEGTGIDVGATGEGATPTVAVDPTEFGGVTWTDLGIVSTVDINGGSIDGVALGMSVRASGNFTTINAVRIISPTSSMDDVLTITLKSTGTHVDGFGPQIRFMIDDTNDTPSLVAHIGARRDGADNEGAIVFFARTNGLEEVASFESDGGMIVGAASGGSQGAGTINAVAVYDDGVVLTDYVSDGYLGTLTLVKLDEYDALVPDRTIKAVFDPDTELFISAPYIEVVNHDAAREFYERGNWVFDPIQYGQYFLDTGHLPQLLSKAEWVAGDRQSVGNTTQALIEIIEILTLQNYDLAQRFSALEGK